MSSFRTQPRPSHNDLTEEAQRPRLTSRIPTKPSSSGSSKKSDSKVRELSRLAKRSSRSLLPVETQKKGLRSPPGPTSAPYAPAVSTYDMSATTVPTSVPNRNSMLSPPATIRTPSLVSGSSVSTFDSPRSSALRRKPSSAIDQYAAQKRAGRSASDVDHARMHDYTDIYAESHEDAVFGTFFGNHAAAVHTNYDSSTSFEDDVPVGVSFNATPPLAMYAPSMTPSTRYADSPFSHVATPSSVSSVSSSIAAISYPATKTVIPSPQKRRPSLSARSASKDETSRLAPVRESSTSSSNKTVRPSGSKSPSTKQTTSHKATTTISPTKTGDLRKQHSRNRLVKEQPAASVSKQTTQRPPELAHLNIDTSMKPEGKIIAPARPSRDGASNVLDFSEPAPVVQSDLPKLYTGYHKRTPSQETTPASAGSSSLRSRFGMSSKSSTRNDSPRIDSAMSPQSITKTLTRGTTPDNASNDNLQLERKDSPAVSISKSSTKSQRFGFFSRKSKSEGAKVLEKPKRPSVKGPAAGTGHEGYSRFGIRGRSSSSISSVGIRSPSTDSNVSTMPKSQPGRNISMSSKDSTDLDEFLRERLNPVVLRGSGVSQSMASTVYSLASPEPGSEQPSTNPSPRSSYTKPQLLPSAMQKSKSTSLNKRPTLDRSFSSDISDDDSRSIYRPSGPRRASYRLSQTSTVSSQGRDFSVSGRRIPVKLGSVDSYGDETLVGSTTSTLADTPNDLSSHEEGLWLRSGPPEPIRKPSRKFPFFQRAQPAAHRPEQIKVTFSETPVRATDMTASFRAVAYYGMPESVEPVELEEVARMVLEGEMSPVGSSSERSSIASALPQSRRQSSLPVPGGRSKSAEGGPSKLLSSPPTIRVQGQPTSSGAVLLAAPKTHTRKAASTSGIARPAPKPSVRDTRTSAVRTPDMRPSMTTPEPKTLVGTPEQLAPETSPRPPRLSPVGRIPRVVSKRDRDRKLPDNSFSRPFAQSQPKPSVKPPGSVYNQIREMASPVDGATQPISSTSGRSESVSESRKSGTFTSAPSLSTGRTSLDLQAQSEFLAFPSRKGSAQSYSTSSDSQSWYITAHAQSVQHDDIWNEYNDLMDEILPRSTPLLQSGFEQFSQPTSFGGLNIAPYTLPPISGAPPSSDLPLPPGSNIVQNNISVPHQIARFLQPSLSPLISESLSAFIGGYGAAGTRVYPSQNRASLQGSSLPESRRLSSTSVRRASLTSSRSSQISGHSRSSSLPEIIKRNSRSSVSGPVHTSTTQLADIAEIAPVDPADIAALRYGAMMTSKWLSFGRVLFSPAHNELQLAEEPRVLVVDGLGSDWSYYVALTYKMASVYNLCPDSLGSPASSWPDPEQKAPRNHFQIPFSGIASPIPFPKGFFNAVVFRFPATASEDAYKFFVSECKRVLRPGGFLEVAVLDLDLVNMGNNMRKAVRDLKTRIQRRDQNLCLQNLSDVLVRLIGRRGFDDVQRCIVGVPAVGRIPRSQDVSSVSSDDGSGAMRSTRRHGKSAETSEDLKFSFADLLDESATLQFVPGNGSNDESITKMVAKVGRWWYSTCYEQVNHNIEQTIWSDRSLLKECERNGTSFRLLICHAQKPAQPRRRTVSV